MNNIYFSLWFFYIEFFKCSESMKKKDEMNTHSHQTHITEHHNWKTVARDGHHNSLQSILFVHTDAHIYENIVNSYYEVYNKHGKLFGFDAIK